MARADQESVGELLYKYKYMANWLTRGNRYSTNIFPIELKRLLSV